MSSGSKVFVVIPARYSSTRLPGKPLIDLNGVPMIVRVYRKAISALGAVAEVVVATDDDRIGKVLDSYDIPFVMTKVDHESGTDRIAEVTEKLSLDAEDLVVNLQGDEPLVPDSMLRGFFEFCQSDQSFEMGTISAPITEVDQLLDINTVKVVVADDSSALYFSRSSIPCIRGIPLEDVDLSVYRKHVGVYAYRCKTLQLLSRLPLAKLEMLEKLEQLRALCNGVRLAVFEWGDTPPHGVDTVEDVQKVIKYLKEVE